MLLNIVSKMYMYNVHFYSPAYNTSSYHILLVFIACYILCTQSVYLILSNYIHNSRHSHINNDNGYYDSRANDNNDIYCLKVGNMIIPQELSNNIYQGLARHLICFEEIKKIKIIFHAFPHFYRRSEVCHTANSEVTSSTHIVH